MGRKRAKTYEVEVVYKAVGYRTFTVQATSAAEAKDRAVAEAEGDDWADTAESEYDAYSVKEVADA